MLSKLSIRSGTAAVGLLSLLSACVDSDNKSSTLVPAAPDDPAVYIDTASVNEGDSGETALVFTVSLNQELDGPVSVNWYTEDGSADQTDYIAANGTITLPAGTTSATAEVSVIGDTEPEYTENFSIVLDTLNNGASVDVILARDTAQALIVNDDGFYLNIQPLNDTGVIACEVSDSNSPQSCNDDNSYANQDAHFGRDAQAMAATLYKDGGGWAGFDFTKLDEDGDDLPNSASQWACVRDNRTGLIWEVKTDDDGLRDRFNTYTWYFEEDELLNGGDAGTRDGGQCKGGIDCDTQSYVAAIEAENLCGRDSGWRLPTPEELRSINDYSRGYTTRPTLDTDYFAYDPAVLDSSLYAKGVWSMLSYYPDEESTVLNRALAFSYQHGGLLSAQKSADDENPVDALYIRLVNGS
ncbi:DUF1566 domain-containing protein [Granulosicoccaceae sp. 1_MG-2023]|nr:DUF1566 domain-containing protein [Granulosicoccaceae sp. 1_MG-2023]